MLLVEPAAKALIGSKLDDAALEKAAEACRAACRPIDDKRGTIAYRIKTAGVLLKRAAKKTPLVISAVSGAGVPEALRALLKIIEQARRDTGTAKSTDAAWHP